MWCTVDIVKAIKPKFVIWENVKNLLSKKHIHNFNNYLEVMDNLGYNSYYKVLNAKDFGVPQNRERVYTISIRKDIDNSNFTFPDKQELTIRLKDILEDSVPDKFYLSDTMIKGFQEHNKNHTNKGTGFIWKTRNTDGIASALRANAALCPTDNTINVGEVTKNSQAGQVYSDEGISPTLIAGTHGYAMGNIIQSCNNSNKCIRVGGIFDTENSKHQIGSIYHKDGLAPSLDTMQGGYRQPIVTEEKTINTMQSENKCIQVGDLKGGKWDKINESCRRVYSEDGISPTIHTCQGGNTEPKVQVKNNSIQKKNVVDEQIIENPLKGLSNYGWHFEQNVYGENSQCCRSVKSSSGSGNIPKIITAKEDNTRNKIIYEEPLERKGWHRKACEVLNTDGISTCIHTQSNNLLQKIKVEERFFKQAIETCNENNCSNGDTIDAFNKKINTSGISPTVTTRPEGFKTAILPIQDYRIRKLTPKECWRLMRFYR